MFHVDYTAEDSRVIAVEHHVPCTEEEHPAKERHDGTFDCLFVDNLTGTQFKTNLTSEELGELLRMSIRGLDDAVAYENPHIISLCKKLEGAPLGCRPIP